MSEQKNADILWRNPFNEKVEVVLMEFSDVYERQRFYRDLPVEIEKCDLRELSGTNCYCDPETVNYLMKMICKYPLSGIHFLDSGNYHYMTRIWMDRIQHPFRLLVFDNHTDLQPPAFGELLSCGGWIANALAEIKHLTEVVLVGPDEASWHQVQNSEKKKIFFLSKERISRMREEEWEVFFQTLSMDLPWYVSIDKDILSMEDAVTNWSQGDLRLQALMSALRCFRKVHEKSKKNLLGVDICGECNPDTSGAEMNDLANRCLLQELIRFYEK